MEIYKSIFKFKKFIHGDLPYTLDIEISEDKLREYDQKVEAFCSINNETDENKINLNFFKDISPISISINNYLSELKILKTNLMKLLTNYLLLDHV